MYVAVKGGEAAIDNAHRLLAEARRGDRAVPELSVRQVREQMSLLVDRVMTEGSLYDPDLAALAPKQARGDVVFLVRAYRTTLPRFGASRPVDTGAMAVSRRISATFKDLPGGQVLGPTFDYTHRLIDFGLAEGDAPSRRHRPSPVRMPADARASQTSSGQRASSNPRRRRRALPSATAPASRSIIRPTARCASRRSPAATRVLC